MFLQCAFKSSVVVTTGVVLLLVLPSSSVCQSDAVQTQESSEPIEEIIVRGYKTLINLKLEIYEAEEVIFDIYHSINSDDDYDIHCYLEFTTGSTIKQRVCKPEKLGKILAGPTQEAMRGVLFGYSAPTVYPTHEIKEMYEQMLAEMIELAETDPEFRKAIESYYAKKEVGV